MKVSGNQKLGKWRGRIRKKKENKPNTQARKKRREIIK